MQKRSHQKRGFAHGEDEQIIAEFTRYLSVTLQNTRIKYLKKYNKIRNYECSIEDLDPGFEPIDNKMEDKIEEMLAWQMVKDYLPRLTPKECEVVLSLYVNRLSTADAAKKLKLTPETVRWHKRNALRKIRKAMEEND